VTYLLGVLFIAAGVAVSIALHELGHLVPAKRSGVKVTQYMIGFGPTLWSRRRGETEYGVKAIPLGGYIRMIGMFPPKPGADPGMLRSSSTGRWSQLMDQARRESLEQVTPGDEDRVFYKLPVWKKLVIMLGGPTMNLIIGSVLLTAVLVGYGVQTETTLLSSVSQCVHLQSAGTAAAESATCSPSDPVAPANAAGLKPGDRVLQLAGRPVRTWDQIRPVIRSHAGATLPIIVERSGRQVSLTVTPMAVDLPKVSAAGAEVKDPTGRAVTERVGFLGTAGSAEYVRQPFSVVPGVIGGALQQTAAVIVHIPAKMVGVAQAAFGSQKRDANGPVSIVGIGRVGGEVAQGRVSQLSSVGSRIALLLSLIASLNFALFVFNLVPLLPLDGGHVAGALWEGLKRQVAKVRGRPNPGYVDVAKALPVAYAMASVLIVMSVLLMYADIVNPIRIGG
jgi:membrane-associated protease RseP (regulator of RpoE activity)